MSAPADTLSLTSGQKDQVLDDQWFICVLKTQQSEEIQQKEVNQKHFPGGPVQGTHVPPLVWEDPLSLGTSRCAVTAEARAPWSLGVIAKQASPTLQLESPVTPAKRQHNPK